MLKRQMLKTSDAQMPAGYEVIVVDNASTDSTAQIARAHLAKFSDFFSINLYSSNLHL